MNRPAIGLKGKQMIFPKKVIHPKQCPKCSCKEIQGYGAIFGYGYINLKEMYVEECGDTDDFEVFDEDNLEYICQNDDCGYSWEL